MNACLHTFCRICLETYIRARREYDKEFVPCPYKTGQTLLQRRKRKRNEIEVICATTFVSGDPLKSETKFDRAIQNLVDKLLPQFSQRDDELKKQIASSFLTDTEDKKDAAIPAENAQVGFRRRLDEHSVSQIIYELLPADISSEQQANRQTSLPALERPFIRSSSKITIRVLRRYLSMYFKVDKNCEIALLCADELLGSDHSLEFVKRTRWHQTDKHMTLTYKQLSII